MGFFDLLRRTWLAILRSDEEPPQPKEPINLRDHFLPLRTAAAEYLRQYSKLQEKHHFDEDNPVITVVEQMRVLRFLLPNNIDQVKAAALAREAETIRRLMREHIELVGLRENQPNTKHRKHIMQEMITKEDELLASYNRFKAAYNSLFISSGTKLD
jgi:hypothetical protein